MNRETMNNVRLTQTYKRLPRGVECLLDDLSPVNDNPSLHCQIYGTMVSKRAPRELTF